MERFARTSRVTAAAGLGALILFAPLAFGSVETWSLVVIETTVFALGALWLAGRFAVGRGRIPTRLEWPIVAFVGLVLLQLLPMPSAAHRVVSPEQHALYGRTVPGYDGTEPRSFEAWLLAHDPASSIGASSSRAAADAEPSVEGDHPTPRPGPRPISYAPSETLDRLLLFVAYALVFFMVADLARSATVFRRFVVWIVFVGMGIAALGIFQKLTWNGKILWFRSPGPMTRPFGPFVNPNHFAAFMELVVPLALGLLLTLLSHGSRLGYRWEAEARYAGSGPEARSKLPWAATQSGAKAVLLGFLLLFSLGSIFLSLSRGGMIATALTFAAFSPLIVPVHVRTRFRPALMVTGLVACALVVAALFYFSASMLPEKLTSLATEGAEPSSFERTLAWKQTLRMIADHAWVGCGLGGFETAFARYAPAGVLGVWKQSHNDYLQIAAETGILGALLASLALWVFARRHMIPALRIRIRADRFLILGLAMAVVSMLLHSLVDFSLQIPAVGFLFVVLGGMLAGQSDPGSPGERRSLPPGNKGFLAAGSVLLLVVAISVGALGAGRITADRLATRAARTVGTDEALSLLELATRSAQGRVEVQTALGDRIIAEVDGLAASGLRSIPQRRKLLDRGEQVYRSVIDGKPLWSWGWWGVGEVYGRRADTDRLENFELSTLLPATEADLPRRARMALAAIHIAVSLDPVNYRILDEEAYLYDLWGLSAKALASYRESARLQPLFDQHEWGSEIDLSEETYRAIASGMEEAVASGRTAEPDLILRDLGRLAVVRGDLEGAERYYRRALAASRSKLMRDVIAVDLGETLRRRGRLDEAEQVLRPATSGVVLGWSAWVGIARICEARGDEAGAVMAIRRALAQVPPADWARIQVAHALVELRQPTDAIALLETAQRESGLSSDASALLARLQEELRRDRSGEAGDEGETRRP